MSKPLLRKKQTTEEERKNQIAWEGDVLDRKKLGETLTPIIKSITQPFVISIGGPYGTGKSWFIQHFQKHLHDSGLKTSVYFNAWESDYTEDPLLALIAALDLQLEKSFGKKTKTLLNKAVPYITRNLAPALLKGGIGAFLGHKNVERLVDLPDEIDGAIEEISEKIVANALQDYKDAKSSMMAFRACLEKIVAELNSGKAEDEAKEQLIVFVDELDRCRPDYAVKVLECIKHFFNVEGVVFILALDEDQLQEVIKNTYGLGDFGESYLRKFIDLRINLPKPSARAYTKALFEHYNMGEIPNIRSGMSVHNGVESLLSSFGDFSEHYNLSLRQQAQCFTQINLYIRSLSNPKASFFPDLLCFLVCVKAKLGANVISDLCFGNKSIEDFLDDMIDEMNEDLKSRLIGKYGGNINVFKSYIHVWFLNEDMDTKLRIENDNLINRLNQARNTNENSLDIRNLEQRSEYIMSLRRLGDDFAWRRSGISHSMALFVYKELEFLQKIQ